LRELSTQKGRLVWLSEHLICFEQIKAAVVESIGHFNMEWDTHIYTDAGPKGLGYVWAIENFDPYIELIFNNQLSKPPARFLSWALRTSHYNVSIVHQPGLGNIADFLSRHPSKTLKSDQRDNADDFINMIVR
jgi:hypothetical protein